MRFKVDHKGIAALKREPQMHVYVNATAMVVADAVQAFAPTRKGFYRAGVEEAPTTAINASARVYARDFKAWWIEFGAKPNKVRPRPFRGKHPMRHAVLAVGLRYVPRTPRE